LFDFICVDTVFCVYFFDILLFPNDFVETHSQLR
jgi:hypothetical protein